MMVPPVEDDPPHMAFLREQVAGALPECSKVVEAVNGSAAEDLSRNHPGADVVMDLQMPGRTGIEAARTIWRERPMTRILFRSNYADEAYVRGISRIVPAGAPYGYVLKSAPEERLRRALRSILVQNQCVIDNEVRGTQARSFAHVSGFSEFEYAILGDIALGLTDRAISERRNLSRRSVQTRLHAIHDKLGVSATCHTAHGELALNLRARAVSVAFLRKLLNYGALDRAEMELSSWLAARERKGFVRRKRRYQEFTYGDWPRHPSDSGRTRRSPATYPRGARAGGRGAPAMQPARARYKELR